MQGETGSLRDLKRYHLEHHGLPRTILEENVSQDACDEASVSDSSAGIQADNSSVVENNNEADEEHLLRLREFQVKLLAASNTAYSTRSKSGRRHTLCLTR